MAWAARMAPNPWFRMAVAALFVAFHVAMLAEMGKVRFGLPFNTAPGQRPAFSEVHEALASAATPAHWNRLVVSRWDAQHYEGIALRGFSQCKKQDLRHADFAAILVYCDFSFYPGYPALGWFASLGGRIPIDYALFALSIVASVGFLFMWTATPIQEALGARATYLSLLLFNVFPTSFALGTVQTEPCALAFILGSVLAIARRRYLLAAFLAGAASGIRISALAATAACGVAILVSLYADRPRNPRAWAARAVALPLSGWGVFTIVAFFWIKYKDPLLYAHAHEAAYAWATTTGVRDRFESNFIFASTSIGSMHRGQGILLGACLLWLALGIRSALAPFAPLVRVHLWALMIFALGVSVYGAWPLSFLGMNRYWLLVLPLFFAMAQVLRRAPAALVLWLVMSTWAYWNVDLCDYIAQGEPEKCSFTR